MSTNIRITRAAAADAAAVLQLLSRNGLPTDGLLEHFDTAIVARDENRIVGCAALEVYRDGALLRSVAVEAKDHGLGTRLTESAIDLAATLSVRNLYLLTTTAERFFPKFGFRPIAREDVPASVQASVEFQSACPASAIVMSKLLSESG